MDVDSVLHAYERLNRVTRGEDDLDAFITEAYHSDVVIEMGRLEGVYRGHAGVKRFIEGQQAVLDDMRVEPEEVIEVGDHTVVPVRLTGRGRDTGIPLEYRFVHVFRFRGERCVHLKLYASKEKALEALAAAPPE